jgi:hypothetical protein
VASVSAPLVIERERPTTPRVSVIIVTWNCATLIGPCLDRLKGSIVDFPYETIVVDNASADETPKILNERADIDVVVLSPTNLGFGRGNNLGATYARGEYLLLLNPDAFLEDLSAFARLVSALVMDTSIAAVGPMLTNPDGSHQVGDAGHAPTLTHVAMHQLFISRFVSGVRGYYITHPADLSGSPVDVGWLGGACQMVRRAAFYAVGGFPADIFMYGEDVELGARLKARGHLLVYLPSIKVLHLQGATQKAEGTVYVSTRWIDGLFAAAVPRAKHSSPRALCLRTILFVGFVVRCVLYRCSAILRADQSSGARSSAMAVYARHVLSDFLPDRPRP